MGVDEEDMYILPLFKLVSRRRQSRRLKLPAEVDELFACQCLGRALVAGVQQPCTSSRNHSTDISGYVDGEDLLASAENERRRYRDAWRRCVIHGVRKKPSWYCTEKDYFDEWEGSALISNEATTGGRTKYARKEHALHHQCEGEGSPHPRSPSFFLPVRKRWRDRQMRFVFLGVTK